MYLVLYIAFFCHSLGRERSQNGFTLGGLAVLGLPRNSIREPVVRPSRPTDEEGAGLGTKTGQKRAGSTLPPRSKFRVQKNRRNGGGHRADSLHQSRVSLEERILLREGKQVRDCITLDQTSWPPISMLRANPQQSGLGNGEESRRRGRKPDQLRRRRTTCFRSKSS